MTKPIPKPDSGEAGEDNMHVKEHRFEKSANMESRP